MGVRSEVATSADTNRMEKEENEKNSLSNKIRSKFGWRRKIVFEKEREDGTGEVTIEVPAKHDGMVKGKTTSEHEDEFKNETLEKQSKTESDDVTDDSYVEVLTTLTELFTAGNETVKNEDVEKVIFEDHLKCHNVDKMLDDTEKLCDIQVHHLPKDPPNPPCYISYTYSQLPAQSYQPVAEFN